MFVSIFGRAGDPYVESRDTKVPAKEDVITVETYHEMHSKNN